MYGYAGGLVAPYSLAQGIFTAGQADPTTAMPASAAGTDNLWVDVSVSDTAPAGYSGSYRLYPSKYDANPSTVQDFAANYDVATQVNLSQSCALNKIWYYSPSGTGQLATAASVWSIATQQIVASIPNPSWSGLAGSGWVSASFPSGVTLGSGDYRVSVYNGAETPDGWNAKDAQTGYWTTGVGASGIVNGPVSAPDFASAAPCNLFPGPGTTTGQPVFSIGPPDQFPDLCTGTDPVQNYFVDLEVTPLPPSSGIAWVVAL